MLEDKSYFPPRHDWSRDPWRFAPRLRNPSSAPPGHLLPRGEGGAPDIEIPPMRGLAELTARARCSKGKHMGAGADFDTQWNLSSITQLGGKPVRVYDIGPAEQESPVPVMIAMGWLNGPYTFKGLMRELVRCGRRVILVDTPHGIDTAKLESVPYIHARKMAAIIEFIVEHGADRGFEQVDILGLSEGCIVAVLLKQRHHDLIRNLVLVNPSGMIGRDHFLHLATRFPRDVVPAFLKEVWKRGLTKKPEGSHAIGSTWRLLRAPHRALQSVLAIAASDSREMLAAICARSGRVSVSVIACKNDRAFPAHRIEHTLGNQAGLTLEIHPGTHNTPPNEPEYFGARICDCLRRLERPVAAR